MVTLRTKLVEPGVYAQFEASAQFAAIPGGLRVLALVGKGKTTAIVAGESVTKGTLDGSDTLAFTAVSLPDTIVDENFVTYTEGVDYQLTGGAVDWSLALAASVTGTEQGTSFNVNGLTLEIFLDDVLQTVTFSGTDPIALDGGAGSIVDQINTQTTGVTASATGSNELQITTDATNNTTLRIGNGTANSVLGMIGGLTVKSSQEPAPGVVYTLDYERAKTGTDFDPKVFFDLDSVVQEYGAVNTTNTLSLGASLAFQNGASVLATVQVDPAEAPDLFGFQQALDRLATVNVNVVVPLSTDTNLHAAIKNHVTSLSSLTEQKFRTAIVGLGGSPTISQIQSLASGLSSRRVALVHPPSATVQLSGQTSPTTVDGSFVAAAIGGLRVNPAFDVAEPLLRKELVGFVSVSDTLLRSQKNVLANSGVMLVELQNNTIRVRDGLTTDLTTADSAEFSVTETIDFVAQQTRAFIENAFIGNKLLNETPGLIHASLTIILQSLIDNRILNDFTEIEVKRNNTDPTQIDIRFKIAPVFPVKFVLITFTI